MLIFPLMSAISLSFLLWYTSLLFAFNTFKSCGTSRMSGAYYLWALIRSTIINAGYAKVGVGNVGLKGEIWLPSIHFWHPIEF